MKPEEGGEPVSARYLTEKGYKQLTGPTFEYDTRQGLWEGVGDYFVEDGDDEDNERWKRVSHGRGKDSIPLSHCSGSQLKGQFFTTV